MGRRASQTLSLRAALPTRLAEFCTTPRTPEVELRGERSSSQYANANTGCLYGRYRGPHRLLTNGQARSSSSSSRDAVRVNAATAAAIATFSPSIAATRRVKSLVGPEPSGQ